MDLAGDAPPADRLRRRQAALARRPRAAAPRRARGVLHRQFGQDGRRRSRVSDALSPPYRGRPRRHARARSASASIDDLFVDIPAGKRLTGLLDLPKTQERDRGRAASRPDGGAERRGRDGAVLRRRRRLPPPRAGERRPPDPALGVPHLLHALPAGDQPGHAAISLRVPDPGGEPDRHGGRQRLHVRRLDRRPPRRC